MQPVTYEAVYYVQSDEDELKVNPIGIRPHITNNMVWWDDTNPSRGTSFSIKKINAVKGEKPPEKIEIITDEGKKVTLTYLTLDVYNKNIRDKVPGKPSFHNNKELQDFYLTTNFSE